MASCANSSCLHGSSCFENRCICTNLCYVGDQCEIPNNILNLPLAAAVLEDSDDTRSIYIAVLSILVVTGLVNNVMSLMTSVRERIRITPCGIYLIFFCVYSFILMCSEATQIFTFVDFNTEPHRLWTCKINSYLSWTMGFCGIWMTTAIAIEYVLIECFNVNMFGSRFRALLTSLCIIVFASLTSLPEIFIRRYALDVRLRSICVYDYEAEPLWGKAKNVFSHIHVIVPVSLHIVCIACILTSIARRKILISGDPSPSLYRIWLKQLFLHRHFFIPPLCNIICVLPYVVYSRKLVAECKPYSDVRAVRTHIAFILLLVMPQALSFFVYVFPNDVYIKEFQQTPLYYCWTKRMKRRSSDPPTQRHGNAATSTGLM